MRDTGRSAHVLQAHVAAMDQLTEERKKRRADFRPDTILSNLRIRRSLLDTYGQKNLYKIVIAFNLILVSIGSLFYTDNLIDKLEERELRQVRLYAELLRILGSSDSNDDFTLIFQLIQEANNVYEIPAIYVNEFGIPEIHNNVAVPGHLTPREKDELLYSHLEKMKVEHNPIPVELGNGKRGYIYYSNSFLLTQLRYYPYIQLSIIFLIGFLAYLAFSSSRKAEQNRVWVGLAKETAHQLGTPLSSLMAWIDYFRSNNELDPSVTDEMEKDVQRLEMITTRFSSIGSAPVMKEEDIAAVIATFIAYLEKRVSTKVKISVVNELDEGQKALINKNLFEWVIENICKNAVDAMSGIGAIRIHLHKAKNAGEINIDIQDTGKGINKANLQKVFNPGFSTKKRGWGLGLTLAKRIIENYHEGRLFVKSSEVGKGTMFRIVLRRLKS